MGAAIAAYPQLGNTDIPGWAKPASPRKHFRAAPSYLQDYTMSPSDATLLFLEKLLTQVQVLFPFPFVHVGGDEVNAGQWERSKLAKSIKQQHNLTDVQSFFNLKLSELLHARGKTMVGWDEVQHR